MRISDWSSDVCFPISVIVPLRSRNCCKSAAQHFIDISWRAIGSQHDLHAPTAGGSARPPRNETLPLHIEGRGDGDGSSHASPSQRQTAVQRSAATAQKPEKRGVGERGESKCKTR